MKGWLLVFAVVSAIDIRAGLTGRPTLSCTFRDTARQHPVAVTAATGYLLAHLYGVLPREADPLSRLGELHR